MIINPIATRRLQCKGADGAFSSFKIEIGSPFLCDNNEYCCEIYADEILFSGIKKAFGLDSIDCLDYALQIIDLETSMKEFGDIIWPDGTIYKRVPASQKMGWI